MTSDSESDGEREEDKLEKKEPHVEVTVDKDDEQTDGSKTEVEKPAGSPLMISTDDQRSTKSASSPCQPIIHGPMHSKYY